MTPLRYSGAALILAASLLAGCGSGPLFPLDNHFGGGSSPAPPPSPTSSPSNIAGGGYAGTSGVAYIPFANGAQVIGPSNAYVGTPVAVPTAGTLLLNELALSRDGKTIYANATWQSGTVIYANQLSATGETPQGSQIIISYAQIGNTLIVPLANGNVFVLTTSPVNLSQVEAEYTSDLTQIVDVPQAFAQLIMQFSLEADPLAANLYAVTQTGQVIKFTPPSTVPIATSGSYTASGPLAVDPTGSKVYTAQTSVSQNSTTVSALAQATLNATPLATINGGQYQIFDCKSQSLLLVTTSTSPAGGIAIVNTSTGAVKTFGLPAGTTQAQSMGAALSADGTSAYVAFNVNSIGTIYVMNASTGTVTAKLAPPQFANGQAILAYPVSH